MDGGAHPSSRGQVWADVLHREASGGQVKVSAYQQRHVQAPVDEEWVATCAAQRREQSRFFQKDAGGGLRVAVLDSHLGP
jgi:hypothetical protein